MTQYRVDSEAVLSTSSALRAAMGRLQGEAATVGGLVTTLQSAWTGSAASAFQGVATEWQATQRRVEECLNGLAHGLGRAGQQYADAEQANAHLFAS